MTDKEWCGLERGAVVQDSKGDGYTVVRRRAAGGFTAVRTTSVTNKNEWILVRPTVSALDKANYKCSI